MIYEKRITLANYCRYTARTLGILFAFGVLIFIILYKIDKEGTENYTEFLITSHKMAPWGLFILFAWISYKWELAGGMIFMFTGILSSYFLNIFNQFDIFNFIFIILCIIIGLLFILSWALRDL